MAEYAAPIWDITFILQELAAVDQISSYSGFDDFDETVVEPVLEEAARFIEATIAPLNVNSDQQGSLRDGEGNVTTPDGFVDAYRAYVDAGWQSVPFDPAYGGGGFPWVIALALQEMLNSACMSFALCPLLTQGAIDLLHTTGVKHKRRHGFARSSAGSGAPR